MGFTEKASTGTSNGTNSVTVVSAPAVVGLRRVVRTITVSNSASTARRVTLSYADDATSYQFVQRVLSQYESFAWTAPLILDNTSRSITLALNSGTDEFHWTAHFAEVT